MIVNLAGEADDSPRTYGYNAAGQIIGQNRANDGYAWNGGVTIERPYVANGLNQYTSAGNASFAYDANGNLTSDATHSYVYDSENRLISRVGGGSSAQLRYDPLGRLYEVSGSHSPTRRFLYDGDALIAEYDAAGTMTVRYIHGPIAGADDPVAWYVGASTNASALRYLFADERGSIVAVTNSAGARIAINSYDGSEAERAPRGQYGIPGSGNLGRFQYTRQIWLPELGL